MSFALLSVVTPAYNEADNLRHLYERIRALDWKSLELDFELLVVDDHSSVGTRSVIADLIA